MPFQALNKEGVQQYNPEGEKFDPNFHNALFEMVDPTKEPGHIGQVTKVSFAKEERKKSMLAAKQHALRKGLSDPSQKRLLNLAACTRREKDSATP
eukprot:1160959-Pelagomonas_calceolata.AAC.5